MHKNLESLVFRTTRALFFFELTNMFQTNIFFQDVCKGSSYTKKPFEFWQPSNHKRCHVVFVLKFFILISFILQEDSNRQVEAEETISRALEGYYRRKGQRKEIRAYSRSRYVRGLRAHSSNSSKYFVM